MLKNSIPPLGAHMSIKGGLERSILRGKKLGCQVIQIFTGNTNQWASKTLTSKEIDLFLKTRENSLVEPVAAHTSYLINLASPRPDVLKKSFRAFLDELERTARLAIPYLVMHPGSHLGTGEGEGIRQIAESLNRIQDRTPNYKTKILLETTAGQGTNLGYRFEHLAEILGNIEARERIGVCLDTCHVFAAGYHFGNSTAYTELIDNFDNIIGLHNLKLIHVNDSKRKLGSKIDRHEHIGLGFIGNKGFSCFLKDPAMKEIPFILETPKGKNKDGNEFDVENLNLLRKLGDE
jgi:deoxyribonuclease-4